MEELDKYFCLPTFSFFCIVHVVLSDNTFIGSIVIDLTAGLDDIDGKIDKMVNTPGVNMEEVTTTRLNASSQTQHYCTQLFFDTEKERKS